jgi:hypothetical protein
MQSSTALSLIAAMVSTKMQPKRRVAFRLVPPLHFFDRPVAKQSTPPKDPCTNGTDPALESLSLNPHHFACQGTPPPGVGMRGPKS